MTLEHEIRELIAVYEEASQHDCSPELLDTFVVRLLKLHKPKYCKDCKFRVPNKWDGWACTSPYMGELPEDSDHSLGYSYTEGGGFIPSEKFGCVNFEKKE